MPNNAIRFEYDAAGDYYVIYPCWHVATEDDCKAWYAEYERFLGPLGRKIDAIFVSHMFSLDQNVGEVWNRYRERLNRTFMRHTVRVFLGTQSQFIRPGMYSDWAPDIESAVEMLEEKRRRG